jgi:Fur family transcriptional regulator, ferric uptake regulator
MVDRMVVSRERRRTLAHPSAEEEALDELRRLGGRITNPRVAVIRVLAGTQAHLTAAEVAAHARSAGTELHLATAYRTLESLSQLGLVRHTHLAAGSATYHLATPSAPAPHAHTQCRSCGAVQDVPQSWLAELEERLASERSFRLESHHAAITGVCSKCTELAR